MGKSLGRIGIGSSCKVVGCEKLLTGGVAEIYQKIINTYDAIVKSVDECGAA